MLKASTTVHAYPVSKTPTHKKTCSYSQTIRKAGTAEKVRNLRQYIKVTVFGDELFEKDIARIQEIVRAFEVHVGEGKMNEWTVLPHKGHRSFESHARYFTDHDLVPFEKNLPFGEGVDPDHILRNLQGDSFIHAADNQVEY
jgi:hypothetical protein